MSKRFWIENNEILDSGFFLSDKQNYVDVMNNLEDIASKWQHKCVDLEAKLAEMERVAENNKKVAELVSAEHITKIEKLEQQLAEKEKLIDEYADSVSKVLIENADLSFRHNQDKISFCIEQLEKVKENFGYKYNSQLMVSSKSLCDYIDNQIKQLKEKNNG